MPAFILALKPFYKYIAGAALVLCLLFAWQWDRGNQYDNGVAFERDRANTAALVLSAVLQEEKEAQDAKYRGAVAATKVANDRSVDAVARLERVLNSRVRNSTSTSSGSGLSSGREAGDLVLRECVQEYRAMGAEAGRLADKVNGLIGYTKILPRWGTKVDK